MLALRPYQIEAADATDAAWADHRSVLIVSATGTGKTVLFIEQVRRARAGGKRSLIIVDSNELVEQTRKKIKGILHLDADIEKAESRAVVNPDFAADVVIATIQSLRSGEGDMRCMRFPPDHFQRIFVDEAHLSITPTTIAVLDYFMDPQANPDGRLAGYTATPDRADGRALGQLYEDNPFRYDILDAINDGYLVPVHGKITRLEHVRVSVSHREGRDFTNEECGEFMGTHEAIVEQGVGLHKRCDGPTIVFCPTVRHAELLAAWLNDNGPGSAAIVSGQTPKAERDDIITRFRAGSIRFLCNCMVLTKGFDCDLVRYVAICRPTKSWALITQMIGRGTRPLDGLLSNLDTPEDRKRAIAASAKPHMTVLSFVGREGPMNLMGPADALAGDMEAPEVSQRAAELMEESDDLDAVDALEQAREEIERDRARRLEQAQVRFEGGEVVEEDTDLFDKREFKVALEKKASVPPRHALTFLHMYGFHKNETVNWSQDKVSRVVEWVQDRHARGLCTRKQANQIKRLYRDISEQERREMTKSEAGRLLGQAMARRRA